MSKRSISALKVSLISLLLILLNCIPAVSADADNYDFGRFEFFIDSSGILCARSDENKIEIRKLYPDTSAYTYSLSEAVEGFCVYRGKIYALTVSPNEKDECFVYALSGGKSRKTTLRNFSISRANVRLAADSKERLYIINPNSKIAVFTRDGKPLGETSERFFALCGCFGKVAAVNQKGIFVIDKTSAAKVNEAPENYSLRGIAEDTLADGAGNLFTFGGRTITLGSKTAVLDEYYITYESGVLAAYDKRTLEKVSEYETEVFPEAIFGFKNKLVMVYNGYDGFETAKLSSKVFKPSKQTEPKKETVTEYGIDLKDYEVVSGYIFVAPDTKRSTFRETISCEGYELNFEGKRNNHIGTGLRAKFTAAGREIVYTFILPGDVNGTGEINKADINLLSDHLIGYTSLEGEYKTAADISRDGKISNSDLVLTERMRKK